MIEVTLDPLANGMQEATVHYWFFEEGDHVEEGSDLLEVRRQLKVAVNKAPDLAE